MGRTPYCPSGRWAEIGRMEACRDLQVGWCVQSLHHEGYVSQAVSHQVRRPCPNEHEPAVGHLGTERWEPEAPRRHGCGLHPRPETFSRSGGGTGFGAQRCTLWSQAVNHVAASQPRGWGAENAWFVAFGYVAVAPFATLSTANFLNSGEWTLQWSTANRHRAVALVHVPTKQRTQTVLDVGWNREVWPEFTDRKFAFSTTTASPKMTPGMRDGTSVQSVSFVNLTNKDEAFLQWIVDQDNPLIQARFNNHLNVGSALGWASDWSLGSWKGRIDMQASWAGGLSQKMAQAWASPESFDETTGAWLVTSRRSLDSIPACCPRFLASVHRAAIRACPLQPMCWLGLPMRGKPHHPCRSSKPSSAEVPMAFAVGVCEPLGRETRG